MSHYLANKACKAIPAILRTYHRVLLLEDARLAERIVFPCSISMLLYLGSTLLARAVGGKETFNGRHASKERKAKQS